MIKKVRLCSTSEELIVVRKTTKGYHCYKENDTFQIPKLYKFWEVEDV